MGHKTAQSIINTFDNPLQSIKMFNKEQLTLLKQFVSLCKANPTVLHTPDLLFFKQWLESLGANIPKAPEPAADSAPTGGASEPSASAPDVEEVESEESEVELDQFEGIIKDEQPAEYDDTPI